MAEFLLFCRTTEIAPQHFEARVFVVPACESGAGLATRSECRIFAGAELAAVECLRMVEAMKIRLARSGHEVVYCAECPMDGNEAPGRISKSLEHHSEERP